MPSLTQCLVHFRLFLAQTAPSSRNEMCVTSTVDISNILAIENVHKRITRF